MIMTQEWQIDLVFNIQEELNSSGDFTGSISFTNNGEYFQGWTLEFDANFEIKNILDAEIVSHVGNHYVIKDVRSNDNVYAGETTTFGFTAHVDNSTITEPVNYIFNQQPLNISSEETEPDTPLNPNNDNFIGEVGTITDLNHLSQTIQFQNEYKKPVVFTLPLSRNGGDPAIARITDIQSDNFSVYIQEPKYKDGLHVKESVSYLVLEAGNWELDDGTILQVGTVDTNKTTASGWETINFSTGFSDTPVILSQTQTDNDGAFVRTRQHQAKANSFQLALEEEEEFKESGHKTESVGWLAIETGEGTWNAMEYQAGTTGDRVTDRWHTLDFSNFTKAPNLLAGLASYDDGDPAGLRYTNLNSDGVQIRVEEDKSLDSEIEHASEVVNFLAIEGTGNLTGIAYDDDNDGDNNTPPPLPTPSPNAIVVGFEQHSNNTKYTGSTQSKDWDVLWSDDNKMSEFSVITDAFARSGNKSLKITYPASAPGGGGAAWQVPTQKEYYLSYWLRFDEDFEFDGPKQSGGKLPGLGGAGGLCSGGQTCDGNNGFTSRYMWRENGRAVLYLYHMDKQKWGDDIQFKGSDGSDKYFERGKWHHLIQRVKINDGNQSNGEVEVWMDREKVLFRDDLRFVTNNKGIDQVFFNTFHGGASSDWWPEREVNAYFDDFVVSTTAADVGL